MGFNRQQRRNLERKLNKGRTLETMKNEVKKQVWDDVADEIDDMRIEIYMNSMIIALHRRFGFGAKRCEVILKDIDAIMVDVDAGEITREQLRDMANKAAGIQANYDFGELMKQTNREDEKWDING